MNEPHRSIYSNAPHRAGSILAVIAALLAVVTALFAVVTALFAVVTALFAVVTALLCWVFVGGLLLHNLSFVPYQLQVSAPCCGTVLQRFVQPGSLFLSHMEYVAGFHISI